MSWFKKYQKMDLRCLPQHCDLILVSRFSRFSGSSRSRVGAFMWFSLFFLHPGHWRYLVDMQTNLCHVASLWMICSRVSACNVHQHQSSSRCIRHWTYRRTIFVCAHLPVGVLAVSHRPIGLAMSSEGFDIMTYEEAQQLVIAPIVP